MNFIPGSQRYLLPTAEDADASSASAQASPPPTTAATAQAEGQSYLEVLQSSDLAVACLPASAAARTIPPAAARRRNPRQPSVEATVKAVFAAVDAGEPLALREVLERLESEAALNSVVNAKDKYGWSLLHVAASQDHVDVMLLLLEYGAQLEMKTAAGLSVWDVAQRAGSEEVLRLLSEYTADLQQAQQEQDGRGRRSRRGQEQKKEEELVSNDDERPDSDQEQRDQAEQGNEDEEDNHAGTVDTATMQSRVATTSQPKQFPRQLHSAAQTWFCPQCQETVAVHDHVHRASVSHRMLGVSTQRPGGITLTAANKGYRMLRETGWTEAQGLGRPGREGRRQPVPTVLKRDRKGLGADADGAEAEAASKKSNAKDLWRLLGSEEAGRQLTTHQRQRRAARVSHFAAHDPAAVAGPPPTRPRIQTAAAQMAAAWQEQRHRQLQERRLRQDFDLPEWPS